MIVDEINMATPSKRAMRMLAIVVALVLVLSMMPMGAMAAPSVEVYGEDDATTVVVGEALQLSTNANEGSTVTWSVYDTLEIEGTVIVLGSQSSANIDAITGMLSGLAPGKVRATATVDGDPGTIDITVISQVGALGASFVLEGGAMVTLGKTKFTGGPDTNNRFWSTTGQASVESNPGLGASFTSYNHVYTFNISENLFVPAAVGQTISIIEVDENGTDIVGYGTFTVTSEDQIGTNLPPVANYTDTIIAINNTTYIQVATMFTDPEGQSLSMGTVNSSNPSQVGAITYYWYPNSLVLTGHEFGTASVGFTVWDETGDKIRHNLDVTVAKQAPSLYNYSNFFTNSALSYTFSPDLEWSDAITTIEVNGVVIEIDRYSITAEKQFSDEDENWIEGEILLHAGVLSEGDNHILIKADGYSHTTILQHLQNSEDSFYTSPSFSVNSGGSSITAKLEVLRNDENEHGYYNQATTIFQLMNGDVPVSTVSLTVGELERYQLFQANFFLVDATNPDEYTVRAFLISGDNADNSQLGNSLATGVTETLLKELKENYYY